MFSASVRAQSQSGDSGCESNLAEACSPIGSRTAFLQSIHVISSLVPSARLLELPYLPLDHRQMHPSSNAMSRPTTMPPVPLLFTLALIMGRLRLPSHPSHADSLGSRSAPPSPANLSVLPSASSSASHWLASPSLRRYLTNTAASGSYPAHLASHLRILGVYLGFPLPAQPVWVRRTAVVRGIRGSVLHWILKLQEERDPSSNREVTASLCQGTRRSG